MSNCAMSLVPSDQRCTGGHGRKSPVCSCRPTSLPNLPPFSNWASARLARSSRPPVEVQLTEQLAPEWFARLHIQGALQFASRGLVLALGSKRHGQSEVGLDQI